MNADVAALPSSSVAIPACSASGHLAATVTPDPDPAVAAQAILYRLDSGPQATAPTSGNPGAASIGVPDGRHRLEYWGEDSVGGIGAHHSTTVLVDRVAPLVAIASDQRRATYARGAVASIDVTASDAGSGLQTDPSGRGELLPTSVRGRFTVSRTAVDRCGNDTTATFAYTVDEPAAIARLRIRPSSFAVASRGASIARRTGARVSYTDTQAATATFTIQAARAARPGGFSHGSCVTRTRAHRQGRRCTRYRTVGSFGHRDVRGVNRFRFTGRVRGRRLASGSYRLRVVARGADGTPGKAAVAAFRVRGR